MGLNLAAPWMLLGLGLLTLPVIAHLTGYRKLSVIEFPTLRFLQETLLRVRRRRRLEAWLLLLLRSLLVAALALLFAQPALTWTARAPAGLQPDRSTVIALDVSASMGGAQAGGTTLDRAIEEAGSILDGLGVGTRAALLTFDSAASVAPPGLTADRSPLKRALLEVRPGFGATDLDAALRRALQVVRDGDAGSANVFVLSDGTASRLPALPEWPADVTVHYHDLRPTPLRNRFVGEALVRVSEAGEGLTVEAEVRSTGPDETVSLSLDLADDGTVLGDVELREGRGSRRFNLPLPPSGLTRATLSLPGDDLPADDRRGVVLQGDSELSVLLVSGEGGSGPRDDEVYYLQRALQPGPGSPSRVRPRAVMAEELRGIEGGAGDVVFLANVADPGRLAADLLSFVRRGGGLFISVGPRVDPDTWNDALGDLLPARFTEVKTRGAGTFEQSPTGLALPPMERDEFAVFRTGGASVFSRVRFGRLLGTEPKLAPDSRVLLRYSDGLPALLEREVGAGRVVLFTSTLDDDWTDLPLRAVFVPLVHQFSRSLSGTLLLDSPPDVEVGASVPLPMPLDSEARAFVRDEQGRETELDPATADESGRSAFRATAPGHQALYWVRPGAEPDLQAVFTVRVPAAESSLSPADRDALLAAVPGLIFHGGAGEDPATETRGEVVRTASLAPWLVGVLLLSLLGEGILGGRRPWA